MAPVEAPRPHTPPTGRQGMLHCGPPGCYPVDRPTPHPSTGLARRTIMTRAQTPRTRFSALRRVSRSGSVGLLLTGALGLSGLAACSASAVPSAYQTEHFDLDSTRFARHFGESVERTCDASRRALLSQGYVVSEPRLGMLNGRKSFQPRVETHIQIDFTISCIADGRRPEDGATAFVSAIQERYALKRSHSSASVGVGPVGNISLPFGASDEAMVRVASETIASPAFYERFFTLVEHYLVYLDDELAPAPPVGEAGLAPVPETRPTGPREPAEPSPGPGPAQSDPG